MSEPHEGDEIVVTAMDLREARIRATDAGIAEITAQCNYLEASFALEENPERLRFLVRCVESTMESAARLWAGYELVARAHLKSATARRSREIVRKVGENDWEVEPPTD